MTIIALCACVWYSHRRTCNFVFVLGGAILSRQINSNTSCYTSCYNFCCLLQKENSRGSHVRGTWVSDMRALHSNHQSQSFLIRSQQDNRASSACCSDNLRSRSPWLKSFIRLNIVKKYQLYSIKVQERMVCVRKKTVFSSIPVFLHIAGGKKSQCQFFFNIVQPYCTW